MSNEGNQIHNIISSSGSGTVINYGSGSGSDFLTSDGSGSTRQKVTVPMVPVPVPVPQHRIIVPNLRSRTFRYWAIRAADMHCMGSSPRRDGQYLY
jgi:hypothetical protein